MIEIKISGPRFYCEKDEAAFFGWLNSMSSISEYFGEGLLIHVIISEISEEDLRDLIGLYKRYNLNMKDLTVFLSHGHTWIANKHKFWYDEMFGT